eukprot:Protomagalhaensia_sp_Gyna_25__2744@NODE_2579_length_1002_cov_8_485981_g2141_i0_p2_GENE_NODE_2579_length_1002_cov_8_485981_g2141_i0NODE_2579_length_1002_cov_8_485981_g2141_i0_p2_ORF_typecomplete_len197_score28_80INTS2/PF14750_6/0_047_NODE_2579_length_1002_cov_8_485981_g2141_i0249839
MGWCMISWERRVFRNKAVWIMGILIHLSSWSLVASSSEVVFSSSNDGWSSDNELGAFWIKSDGVCVTISSQLQFPWWWEQHVRRVERDEGIMSRVFQGGKVGSIGSECMVDDLDCCDQSVNCSGCIEVGGSVLLSEQLIEWNLNWQRSEIRISSITNAPMNNQILEQSQSVLVWNCTLQIRRTGNNLSRELNAQLV